MFQFTKSVWAVGQGGFASGVLKDDKQQLLFSYVYDCGSDQSRELVREIDFARQQCDELSVVFLSHLDTDHVNGFDRLCGAFNDRINEVVLPYLDNVSRYYMVARELGNKAPSFQLLEFLVDPEVWIRRRLPNASITYLGRPADGDELEGGGLPDPQRNESQGSRVDEITSTGRSTGPQTVGDSDLIQYQWVSYVPTGIASRATPIQIIASTPPRSNARLDAFKSSLKKAGFSRMGKAILRAVLRDSVRRAKLRECYLELASDHNIVSIHLLVRTTVPVKVLRSSHPYYTYSREEKNLSVLFSGDAMLGTQKYFKHWQATYKKFLDEFTIFSLPHHGSQASFNPLLINAMPNALFIAQAGRNSYGHPHDDVIDAIEMVHRDFHKVDEDRNSRIVIDCAL